MNADGSGVVRLATGVEPAWSPDGSMIAFVTGALWGEGTGNGIYSMSFDGSGVTAVVTGGGVLFPRAPAWSADGSKLAGYVPGAIRVRPPRILVANSDGSGRVDLAPPGAYPAWSPDGRIAFRCNTSPGPGICVMNSDGSLLTLVRNDPYTSEPAWAPDGTKIAFVREGTGASEVWVMNAVGGGVTQLTHDQASVARPAWSPDGTRIAFASTRDGNWEIYVMNADGTGVTRLTDNTATDTWPSWSP
jgi:Tol biopolymer transport system component